MLNKNAKLSPNLGAEKIEETPIRNGYGEGLLAAGDKDQAKEALRRVQPELARGVAKGVLHKNTASRKLSRLSARVKAMSASASPASGRTTRPLASLAVRRTLLASRNWL